MTHQRIAERGGDGMLQLFDLFVAKLDDATRLHVDQMIVVITGHLLIARPAVAEIVASEDVGLLEQANGPIDRRDADLRIDLNGAAVDALDIWVIHSFRQNPGDDAALIGHLQPFINTQLFQPRCHSARF